MKKITTFILITIFFAISIESKVTAPKPINDKKYNVKVKENDLVIGQKNAPLTIVSYLSLTCIHCGEFHTETVDELYKDYIKPGKLKIILRHFPLDNISLFASVMIEQEPKEKRLGKMKYLFEKQREWLLEADSPIVLANMCNVTLDKFKECVKNKENQSPILKQWLDAKHDHDIDATPSFIVQDKLYEGLLSLEQFKFLLDKYLKEIKSARS